MLQTITCLPFWGLDILNKTHLNGMKLILPLNINWHYHNGVGQFVCWRETEPEIERPVAKPSGDSQIRSVGSLNI